MQGLRADIQVLRAVAVLSVLVFHFEIPGLDKGFLGVDIFFVISGYLMSGAITRDMDAGRFRASRFYLRRARRLLPAAFATLAFTTVVSGFVLTPSLLSDYGWQLLGALTFSANFVLWQQSGYFDGAAALKPLLHMWSLSLEEQFYFLLPACLAVIRPRWRLPLLSLLLLGSACACLLLRGPDPSGTFYLLHTRAWELLIGSVCALPGWRARWRLPFDIGWICLPLLAFALMRGIDPVHPRGDAWLVCLATGGLIAWPSKMLESSGVWMRPLRWVGDRSYSLYLVHWPLVALAQSIWLEGVPAKVHAALLGLSFVLAHASYEWVEQPARRLESAGALARHMMHLMLPLLAACAWLLWQLAPSASRTPGGQASYSERRSERDWQQALRTNYGFARACDHERNYKPRPECASSPRPRTLIWGDSYAMHLVPALLTSAPKGGIAQATRSACAPLMDMARRMPDEPAHRAARCLSFNASVLEHLARSPHVEFVVLSAKWQYLFTDPVFDGRGQRVQPDAGTLAHSLAETIRRVRALGKKVILVSPPASVGPALDLGLCVERRILGLWTVTPSADARCGFEQGLHMRANGQTLALLETAADATGTYLVRLDDFTCPDGHCTAMIDGRPLYRDAGHLSHGGSRLLGMRMGWAAVIARESR